MWIVEISDLFPPSPWEEGLKNEKPGSKESGLEINFCFLATSQVEIKYASET